MYNILLFVKKEGTLRRFAWKGTQDGEHCDVLPVPLQSPFKNERFLRC